MSSGYVKLNREFFDPENLEVENMHQLSQGERISYPTLLKYLKNDNVTRFDGNVLYSILIAGMGFTPEEAGKLTLEQVFDFVQAKEVTQ